MVKTPYAQDITVLLLDDMPLTRECLSISINMCDRGVHVLTAASFADAVELLGRTTAPDVILCNLSADGPGKDGTLARLRGLIDVFGRTPLIVLSDREAPDDVMEAFSLGVRGYMATTVGLSVALEAIRLVAAGGTFVPATVLQHLMQAQDAGPDPAESAPPPAPTPDETSDGPENGTTGGLTPRQMSVLKCMKEGKPNKIIAHELGMRESTVKVHVRSILKKLGASNRTEAVYRTLRGPE